MAVFAVLLLNGHEVLVCGVLCVDSENVGILWVGS